MMKKLILLILFTTLISANENSVPSQIVSYLKNEISKEEAITSLRETNSFYNLIDFEVLNNDINNPKVKWKIQFGQQKLEKRTRQIASTQAESIDAPIAVLSVQDILKKLKEGIYTEEQALLMLKEINFPYNVLSLKLEGNKLRWHIGMASKEQKMKSPSLWQVLADYKKDKVSKAYVLEYLKRSNFSYNVVDINKDERNELEWKIQYGKNNNRDIASSSITSFDGLTKKSKNSFSILASYGAVGVSSNVNNDLSLNFLKIGGIYHRKLKSDLVLSSGVNMTRFTNIDYTGASEQIHPSSIYPELSFKLTKNYSQFSLGLGYNLLNYFITNKDLFEVRLTNTLVNRLNASFGYRYNDKVSLSLSSGFLAGSNSSLSSGFDFSASASYKLDSKGKYNLALSLYRSYLKLGSGSKDEGQGFASSFIYNF